jgi:hypothetical protein
MYRLQFVFGGNVSQSVNERTGTTQEEYLRKHLAGTPIKMVLKPVHDRANQTIMFNLYVAHLPGENERDYFIYGGQVIKSAMVDNPKVALFESPRVRTFVNSLMSQPYLKLLSFNLTRVKVHYGTQTSFERVTDMFVRACKAALSLTEDEIMVVLVTK